MLKKVSRWLRKDRKAHRPAPGGARRTTLNLEPLEDRLAPANLALTFTPGSDPRNPTNVWSDPANWAPNRTMPDGSGTDSVTVNPPAAGGFTTGVQDVSANIAALTVSAGGGNLTVSNTMTVGATGVGIGGGGTLTVSSPMTVGSAGVTNAGGTLTVTSQLQTVSITSSGGTAIPSGGELDITGSGVSTFTGPSFTVVSGTLAASNSPTINMAGGGTLGGSMGAGPAGDCTITFFPGSGWNQTGDGSFTLGHFFINGAFGVGGTFNPNSYAITVDNNGGTGPIPTTGAIAGTGSMTTTRFFTWDGGGIGLGGGFTISASTTFLATTNELKTLGGVGMTNVNLVTDLAGTGGLTINAGATFLNESGIVSVSLPAIAGTGTFENDATLKCDAPAGAPTAVTSGFNGTASGEVQVADGSVLALSDPVGGGGGPVYFLDGNLQLTGTLTLAGDWTSPSGLSQGPGAGSFDILAGATLAVPDGETFTVGGNTEVMGGGAITGAGQLTVSTGVLRLDDGSGVEVGSYTEQGTGTLVLEVASATSYATLAVDGLASLSGTLQLVYIDGYVPQSGDTLGVLADGSLSGQFDTPPPGWDMSYGPVVTATKS